ncbi:hypothetical protein RRG08_001734 [Elysia crispata]|uniref:Uncharacterized protein n=1 Tax=Elysia crispata TaxID=231223 RepID=A0AAE1E023_9GAST|nr:hypothetical protein RRG08_001734 [Elysia crispata]
MYLMLRTSRTPTWQASHALRHRELHQPDAVWPGHAVMLTPGAYWRIDGDKHNWVSSRTPDKSITFSARRREPLIHLLLMVSS